MQNVILSKFVFSYQAPSGEVLRLPPRTVDFRNAVWETQAEAVFNTLLHLKIL